MVKIYLLDISQLPDPKQSPEILEGLDKNRIEKILRYRQVKDRKQSLGAGILIKKCLSEKGISLESVYYSTNGKPEADGIYFNVSHSYDKVICAVNDKPVGCDIEKIHDIKEGLAKRYFSARETAYLNQFTGERKIEEFYRIWTMKESYLKMTGEGMRLSLDRVEIIFDDGIHVYRDGKYVSCFIKEYDVPGYKLTVCTEMREGDTNDKR